MSLLGVRMPDVDAEWVCSLGVVTETTGIGVSRFTNGSACSLLMVICFI